MHTPPALFLSPWALPCPPAARPTRRRLLMGAAAGVAGSWLTARAQQAPGAGVLTLVVSYPEGGGADLMARLLAPRLADALGRPVRVENQPGESGRLAAARVARAAPDGATLLVDASSFAVNPSIYPRLPYDSDRAFSPLAVLATFPNVLVCPPAYPARSIQEVIQLARSQPGSVAFASSGNGSAQHLAGALFEQRAGIQLMHRPQAGGGPALAEVMAGRVPLFFANLCSSLHHIQSGRLRALAVTAPVRARPLPQVPTLSEVGVGPFDVLEWNPVLAPQGLPAEPRARLVAAVRAAMAHPDVLARISALGGQPLADTSPEAAARFIQAQRAFWAKVVRERRIAASA